MIRAKSTLSTPRCASTVSDPVPPVSPACSVPPFFGFPAAAGLELVDEGVGEEPHATSAVAPPTATAPTPAQRRKSRRPRRRGPVPAHPPPCAAAAQRRPC